MSAEDVQAKARRAAEPVLHEANSLAQTLGLGPVTPLRLERSMTLPALPNASKRTKRDWASASRTSCPLIITISSCSGCISAPKQRASNGALAPCRCRRAPRFGAMQPWPALLRRFGSRWPPRLVIENSPVKCCALPQRIDGVGCGSVIRDCRKLTAARDVRLTGV